MLYKLKRGEKAKQKVNTVIKATRPNQRPGQRGSREGAQSLSQRTPQGWEGSPRPESQALRLHRVGVALLKTAVRAHPPWAESPALGRSAFLSIKMS